MRITPDLILWIAACAASCNASSPAIGMAMATGTFKIDNSQVQGNATLFEGTDVKTDKASAKLRVRGTRLELAVNSRAKVRTERTILETGSGQIEGPSQYVLEARTLQITSDKAGIARVELKPGNVLVSAVNGQVRVRNRAGYLVAELQPGTSLYFNPQGESDAMAATGCVLKKGGKFVLVESTTSQVFELRGGDLDSLLGNRGEINGKVVSDPKPIGGASQAVAVSSSKLQSPGGCLAVAQAIGADPLPGTAQVGGKGKKKAVAAGAAGGAAAGAAVGAAAGGAAAGAAAGISTGVIVGVGVAAAAGGTAAAVALGHSSSSKSP